MLTPDGPKVIEYNARFGDPEAQAVLPLIKSDILELMIAVHDERLGDITLELTGGASCCVVLASGGYPGSYATGYPISGLADAESLGATVYHAGTKQENGSYVTAGGRVLGVTCTADTLPDAVAASYNAAAKVSFTGMHYRRDIGADFVVK
jgi:phosphoribosylamine--glycine ligase